MSKVEGQLGCLGTTILWLVCISIFVFFVFIMDEMPPVYPIKVVFVEIDNGLYTVVRPLFIP